MKVLIEVNEQIITDLRNGYARLGEIADAVKNGIVLPNGYGDLIDRDKLLEHAVCKYKYDCMGKSSDCDKCSDNCVEVSDIREVSAIIEADKGGDYDNE